MLCIITVKLPSLRKILVKFNLGPSIGLYNFINLNNYKVLIKVDCFIVFF